MAPTILLADADARFAQSLVRTLELEGYGVLTVGTGQGALRQAAVMYPDLILLAEALLDVSGVAVCRSVRDMTGVPIFLLSERHQETHKVIGLDAGADDFITRPLSTVELLAQIRAGLRRMGRLCHLAGPTLQVGDLTVDVSARRVSADGRDVDLTQREFELLRILIENRGQVLTRQRLLHAVWGPDFYGTDRILDVYVSTLRKKIELNRARRANLTTVRGVGYRIDAPRPLSVAS